MLLETQSSRYPKPYIIRRGPAYHRPNRRPVYFNRLIVAVYRSHPNSSLNMPTPTWLQFTPAVLETKKVWTLSARWKPSGEMQDMVQGRFYFICQFVVLAVLTYALSWCMLRAMTSCPKRTLQVRKGKWFSCTPSRA